MRTTPFVLLLGLLGCPETKTITVTVPGETVTIIKTETVTEIVEVDEDCDYDDAGNPVVCTLSGALLGAEHTLTADIEWILRGGVFVGNDVDKTVLNIEPGTKIYGEVGSLAFLTVRRNSMINAVGTADAPIVFTSSAADGSRNRGDWGGVILNGKAPVNSCASSDEPDAGADCEAVGEGGTGSYGGTDPADNSGVMKYVRIEFAGTLLSPDNELNGLGLQGVGSGTELDYIQIHMNADDGIEFFGGAAQAKHIYVTGAGDDNLDWTDGWVGKLQFFVSQQYADDGDNGIEADNNGDVNNALPLTNPTISNVTLVGSPNAGTSDIGALLREGTAGQVWSAVIAGWNDRCLDLADADTITNANGGLLVMAYSLLDCATSYSGADETTFFTAGGTNITGASGLMDPFNEAAPDLRPSGASASGGVTPADAFFDSVTYRGGIDPASDWTVGWTTADQD